MDNMVESIFPKAKINSDIFFYGIVPSTAFTDKTQDDLFEIEDNSWWFKHRARVIFEIIGKFMKPDMLTVDIGGGNGFTTNFLEMNGFNMLLLEPNIEACRNAKKRGLKNVVCGTLSEADVADSSISQAMLLDVIEHIENDTDFLTLLYKKLKPDGKVLITVPAFMALWSSEDDLAGHFRRYKIKSLKEAAEKSGFSVKHINYFMEFAFLPILLIRVFLEKIGLLKKTSERSEEEEKKISAKQFKKRGGIVGAVLSLAERIELKRIASLNKVRFGSSLICVLEKNAQQ